MKAWEIVAWAKDGEVYCPDCAQEAGLPKSEARQKEEEWNPVFAVDENPDGLWCGGCGECIEEGSEEEVNGNKWWVKHDPSHMAHRFAVYTALYYYCGEYHSGQDSALYRVLSRVLEVYRPGPLLTKENALDNDWMAREFYEMLVDRRYGQE